MGALVVVDKCLRCETLLSKKSSHKIDKLLCTECQSYIKYVMDKYVVHPKVALRTQLALLMMLVPEIAPSLIRSVVQDIEFLGETPRGLEFQSKNGKTFYVVPSKNAAFIPLEQIDIHNPVLVGTVALEGVVNFHLQRMGGNNIGFRLRGKSLHLYRSGEICHVLDEEIMRTPLNHIQIYTANQESYSLDQVITDLWDEWRPFLLIYYKLSGRMYQNRFRRIKHSIKTFFSPLAIKLNFLTSLLFPRLSQRKKRQHYYRKLYKRQLVLSAYHNHLTFIFWAIWELLSLEMTNARATIIERATMTLFNYWPWLTSDMVPTLVDTIKEIIRYRISFAKWFSEANFSHLVGQELKFIPKLIKVMNFDVNDLIFDFLGENTLEILSKTENYQIIPIWINLFTEAIIPSKKNLYQEFFSLLTEQFSEKVRHISTEDLTNLCHSLIMLYSTYKDQVIKLLEKILIELSTRSLDLTISFLKAVTQLSSTVAKQLFFSLYNHQPPLKRFILVLMTYHEMPNLLSTPSRFQLKNFINNNPFIEMDGVKPRINVMIATLQPLRIIDSLIRKTPQRIKEGTLRTVLGIKLNSNSKVQRIFSHKEPKMYSMELKNLNVSFYIYHINFRILESDLNFLQSFFAATNHLSFLDLSSFVMPDSKVWLETIDKIIVQVTKSDFKPLFFLISSHDDQKILKRSSTSIHVTDITSLFKILKEKRTFADHHQYCHMAVVYEPPLSNFLDRLMTEVEKYIITFIKKQIDPIILEKSDQCGEN